MSLFAPLEIADKRSAVEKIIRSSTAGGDFFFLIVLSVSMATLGLLLNSVTVVIGSMLLAPMLYPIVGFGLGISISNGDLIKRSLFSIAVGVIYGLIISFLVTVIFNLFMPITITGQIAERLVSNFTYFFIALIAGTAGTYTICRPALNETLPGTAIAVALVPPIAVIGIGIALFDTTIIISALGLLTMNLVGIALASSLIFAFLDFSAAVIHREVKQTITEEAKKLSE